MYRRQERIVSAEIGTNNWLRSHPSYLKWKESASGILWIEGKPGSGKSVLAKSIRKQFLQPSGPDNPKLSLEHAGSPLNSAPISCWFYSKRETLVAHAWMLRSILVQILEQSPSLFLRARQIYRNRRRPSSRNGMRCGASPLNEAQWDPKDIQSVLPSITENSTTKILCVLDGFDESADGSNECRKDMLSFFGELVQNSSNFKVIVLSRLTVDIEKELRKCYHIVMQDENSADVARIIDVRVQDLVKALREDDSSDEDTEEEFSDDDDEEDDEKLKHVSYANWRKGADPGTREKSRKRSLLMKKPTGPSKRRQEDFEPNIDKEDREVKLIQQYLTENARGVILWVTTVLDTLLERFGRPLYDLREIRKELERLPKDLQDLYHDIAKGLHDSLDTSELEMARRALMWTSVVASTQPFHVTELFDAMAIDSKVDLETNSDIYPGRIFAVRSWTQARRKLQRLCGPFIEMIPPAGRTHNGFPKSPSTLEVDREVQLLHQTVKDFLEDERCAGQLYIPFQAAQKLVEEESRIYVRIALPAKARDYSPIPVRDFSQWESSRQYVIEYLEKRRLLPLILGNHPNLKDEVSGNYLFVFGRSEMTTTLTQSDTIADETLSKVARELWLGEGDCDTDSNYFEVACIKGYITATKTLLHLATKTQMHLATKTLLHLKSLSFFQKVYPSERTMIRRLARFHDRISFKVKKPADPATIKALETQTKRICCRTPAFRPATVVKLHGASLTDRTKAQNVQEDIQAVIDFYQRLGFNEEFFYDMTR